jgi:hypothetical protein
MAETIFDAGARQAAFSRHLQRARSSALEVPNLLALNFILHDSLGGGGSESLLTDAQGKTHGLGLLQMEMEVPENVIRNA